MIKLKVYLKERFGDFTTGIIKRMAKGAFWSFTGSAFAKAIVLVSSIFCAHILGKAEYGEFGMVRSTINMFVALGSAGMGVTASKYISEYLRSDINRVARIYKLTNYFAIITGVLVAIVVLLISSYLANNTLNAPHLSPALRIGALLLFVTIINGAQAGTISGFENFKALAINNFIGSCCESVLMLVGATLYGVSGAVLGFGSGYVALYFCNNITIKKHLSQLGVQRKQIHVQRTDLRLLYKFSLPAAISSMIVAPSYWLVRTIVVNYGGFEELAMYEAADQWRAIILFIPSAISHIILPILSSTLAESKAQFWRVFKLNLIINVSVAAIIAAVVVILSPYIMTLYGSGYADGTILMILALSTVFSALSNVIGVSIYSHAKTWMGLLFNTIWAITMISLSYEFVKHGMGAKGMALAVTISYMIHSVIEFMYLRSLNVNSMMTDETSNNF